MPTADRVGLQDALKTEGCWEQALLESSGTRYCEPTMNNDLNRDLERTELARRDFLRLGAAAAGIGLASSVLVADDQPPAHEPAPAVRFRCGPLEFVRIGFVGVGGMGTHHVRNLLNVSGVRIQAVCDIRPEHAERARDIIVEAGQPTPTLYTRGERDFERLCAEEDLDLVFTATPWRWHVPVCVAAMKHGKHAATEVPAGGHGGRVLAARRDR